MAPVVLQGVAGVKAAVGRHLGYSAWTELTAQRVDQFVSLTGGAEMLPLALSNELLPQVVDVQGVSLGVNYGVDRVRFPQPVAPGDRLRAGVELRSADEIPGGVQTVMRIVIEVEGRDEPACEIDAVSRYLD